MKIGGSLWSSMGPSSPVALEISTNEIKGASLADCLLLHK